MKKLFKNYKNIEVSSMNNRKINEFLTLNEISKYFNAHN